MPAGKTAIEFLTLWIEHGEDAKAEAVDHVTNVVLSPESSSLEIIIGQLNVSMMLLYKLARERAQPGDDLSDKARGILQELSLNFPDER